MSQNSYPQSLSELDLDAVVISPEIAAAVKRFAAAKPYRGTIQERQDKFAAAARDICIAAGVTPPRLLFVTDERESSGSSGYNPATRSIILRGRLSVITALHEIGHMLHGPSEHVACDGRCDCSAMRFHALGRGCDSRGIWPAPKNAHVHVQPNETADAGRPA